MKKEDIIRHFKWHKKRSDSLQHGFMRFSPLEDCSQKFPQASCVHNGKHTHYHCLQVRYADAQLFYVAAKATYIRLLHGKIGFFGFFFGPSSVKMGRAHIVLG